MFEKEKEEARKRIVGLVELQDKISKHKEILEAVDKYLEITEFKNNWINEGKIVEFDSPINGKNIVIAFKVNGQEKQFTFIVGRLVGGKDMDSVIKERFSREFAEYIYNQIKK